MPPCASRIYRCEATSLEGFIKQLAVTYVGRSKCFFYITGLVSSRLSAREHDRRIIAKYGLNISKWQRSRAKRAGIAPVHYLRYREFWVLLAGHGRHAFYQHNSRFDPHTGEQVSQFHDIRQRPIEFWFDWNGEQVAYAIGYSGGKAKIAIQRRTYLNLKTHLVGLAPNRTAAHLAAVFYDLPFEPYGPVVRQLFCMLRAVNEARDLAGLKAPVPHEAVWVRRKPVKPFESVGQQHLGGNRLTSHGARSRISAKSEPAETVQFAENQVVEGI